MSVKIKEKTDMLSLGSEVTSSACGSKLPLPLSRLNCQRTLLTGLGDDLHGQDK